MICKKCVLDESVRELELDKDGVCQFCRQAEKSLKDIKKDKLPKIEGNILIGLSGGVDSSMVLHEAVKMGLKPIAFTLDNGWNDPKADANIKRLTDKLGIKVEKVTVDKEKYADLQNAFIKAGLPNIEIPTDHILMTITYKLASKYNCKWILSGGNVATESIMPPSWSFNARDLTHIKDVYKKNTGKRLTGLPVCGLLKLNYYWHIKGIKILYLLDFLSYNRDKAIELLEKEYGYENYGDKHEESVWTKWFQSFYLFEKFGIDKRKAHYSSLINSKQMTREEAIERLQEDIWFPELGIEKKVMSYKKHAHEEYKIDLWYNRIAKIVKLCKK